MLIIATDVIPNFDRRIDIVADIIAVAIVGRKAAGSPGIADCNRGIPGKIAVVVIVLSGSRRIALVCQARIPVNIDSLRMKTVSMVNLCTLIFASVFAVIHCNSYQVFGSYDILSHL